MEYVTWLLDAVEPAVQLKMAVSVLGADPASAGMVALRAAVRAVLRAAGRWSLPGTQPPPEVAQQ